MTSPADQPPVPDHELEPVAADPGALPRPEEEVADAGATPEPAAPPTAQLDLSGEPAQGEGASDSY